MSLLTQLFGRKRKYLLPVVPEMLLPSITVCIFGPIESVIDVRHIEQSYLDYIKSSYPSENPYKFDKYYQQCLSKKYQVLSIPDRSGLGSTDKPNRLGTKLHEVRGEVLLLLEKGATISSDNGRRVLNVLSEFSSDSTLMLVQGKGYHTFVRYLAFHRYDFGCADDFCCKGVLRDHCKRFGLSWKRIDYITIDPRNNRDYKW